MSKKGSEIINVVNKIKERKETIEINFEKKKKEKKNNEPVVDLLKILLNIQSKKHKVSANLISSVSDLNRIVNEDNPDIQALKGWRYKIFGKYALEIKKGEIIVKINDGKIKFTKV
jgi:Ribonuclease D